MALVWNRESSICAFGVLNLKCQISNPKSPILDALMRLRGKLAVLALVLAGVSPCLLAQQNPCLTRAIAVLLCPRRGDPMNVLLKPELERFVAEKVRTGQYTDASDIVNQALEVLQEQEEFTPEHEEYLRGEVRRGLEQLDAGQSAVFDARKIIAEERQRLAGGKERSGGRQGD